MKQLILDRDSIEISTQNSKLILEKTKGLEDLKTLKLDCNSVEIVFLMPI